MSTRALYNASQNGILIVDARPAAAFAADRVVGAQHLDAPRWEFPDDPRAAIVYSEEVLSEERIAEVAARIGQRLAATKQLQVVDAPFSAFAAAFPFVCEGRPEFAGGIFLPHSVADGVWIGSALHGSDPAVLRAVGVKHVVRVLDDPVPLPGAGFTVTEFRWIDSSGFRILDDLPAAVTAIEAGRVAGGVLVHCYHGKSRSASAVAAWLMHSQPGLGADAAHALVQAARPIVAINEGFLAQLRSYKAAA